MPLNRRFHVVNRESTLLLYLRLLGGLVLEEDGEALTGRAAQKRRLALLALLAAAPGRSLSRSRITGLLWPDKDDEQARHLLSVAAYEIRKELGEDAIVSRGDDVVLDPLVVRTDIDDLESAIERGDHEAAVALYRGPFLDGFLLGGSVDFEHWTDQERGRFARLHKQVLVARAEAHEEAGDRVAAADAWRKAANADRFDSRIALRLLAALDAAGNRAGALQFARIHQELLQQEFGTPPAPEFTAAVERIRSRTEAVEAPPPRKKAAAPVKGPAGGSPADPPPAAGAEAAPVAAGAGEAAFRVPLPGTGSAWRGLTIVAALLVGAVLLGITIGEIIERPPERLRVAVLPFEADSADRFFADGLAEQIADALANVEGVEVPAWSAALTLRDAEPGDAARRLGVDHVLLGSVHSALDSLRVRVRLAETDGINIWNGSYDASRAEVSFSTWDHIATAVLEELDAQLGRREVRDPGGGTENVLARQAYDKGRYGWLKRTPPGLQQALHYFVEAVQHDPEFALAHVGIADALNIMGAYDYAVLHPDSAFPKALAEAELAIELAPDLAAAHAARANALFAYRRDSRRAEDGYLRAIELQPNYPEAYHWYSLLLIARGDTAKSIEMSEQAFRVDSLSPVMRSSRARHRYFRNDYQGALHGYREALAREPGFSTAYLGLGLTQLALDQPDSALASFQAARVVIGPDNFHPLIHALNGLAHARAGRPDSARAALATLDAIADTAWVPGEAFALLHLGLGDHDAAIDAFHRALEDGSSSAPFFDVDPIAAPLRGNPDFEELVRRGKRSVIR